MKNLLLRFLVCVMAGLAAASCSDDKPSYMNLSDKEISVSSDGGILTMTVTANVHYVVNHDNDWFSIVSTSNEGDATVFTIQVSANEDTSPRSGRIKFIGDDVTPKALAINQSAMVPTGVSVKKIEVEPQVTTASFTVLGEGEWTATCSNPDFVLSPSSGNGETNVTVTFPANRTAEEVKADITVTIGGQHYTVSIIQAAVDLNIITEWAFDKSVSEYSETWGNGNFDKTKAGFIDSYANASTGSGTIRFYNSDKSDRPDDGKGMRVQTGGHGDIIVRGIVTTDYWLIECSNPMLGEIPANKQMRFEFTGHIFSGCAAYWMCEYLDSSGSGHRKPPHSLPHRAPREPPATGRKHSPTISSTPRTAPTSCSKVHSRCRPPAGASRSACVPPPRLPTAASTSTRFCSRPRAASRHSIRMKATRL